MEHSNNGNGLYIDVLLRVRGRLSSVLEFLLTEDSQKTNKEALTSILKYPAINYLSSKPAYAGDFDSLQAETVTWLINLVSTIMVDWTMLARNYYGKDLHDGFIADLSASVNSLKESKVLPEDYIERFKSSPSDDTFNVTVYLMAVVYREIVVDLGRAHGRATSKPAN